MASRNRTTTLATLAGLAIALYTAENFLPTPLPWLRPGLSNVAVLLALAGLGPRGALAVFLLKVIVGSFLAGRFLSPFFFFGLAGGGMSLLAMTLTLRFLSPPLTIVGVSVLGGVAHNMTQLILAYFVFVHVRQLFYLTPVLVLLGAATGALTGIAARLTLDRVSLSFYGTPGQGKRA